MLSIRERLHSQLSAPVVAGLSDVAQRLPHADAAAPLPLRRSPLERAVLSRLLRSRGPFPATAQDSLPLLLVPRER